MSPALLGAIRGAGSAVVVALIAYFADPGHLTFLSVGAGAEVSAVLLAIEHAIANRTGNALFGAVKMRK